MYAQNFTSLFNFKKYKCVYKTNNLWYACAFASLEFKKTVRSIPCTRALITRT